MKFFIRVQTIFIILYHFILVKEVEGQFEFLGENKEKYKNFPFQ